MQQICYKPYTNNTKNNTNAHTGAAYCDYTVIIMCHSQLNYDINFLLFFAYIAVASVDNNRCTSIYCDIFLSEQDPVKY